MAKEKLSLYIHIPFCVSKCSYCDFCSFVPQDGLMPKYIEALKKEIKMWGKLYKDRLINTIYIGGGTPSVLPAGAILDIIDCVKANFDVDPDAEITIEANPNSMTRQKAQEYKLAGCTRLSLGLQAIKPEHLKLLNRKHDFEQCKAAVFDCVACGITNINVDILLGIPTQTIWDVRDLLGAVVALPISHVSAYSLINEPDTPLTKKIIANEIRAISSSDTVNYYDFAVDFLAEHGFLRYEISNFAKPGCESRHNLNYWQRGEFLGLGLAAYSFCDGVHWENESDIKEYLRSPTKALRNYSPETTVTAKEEYIMLFLRTTKGLDINKYNQMFDADFLTEHQESLEYLINVAKLVEIRDGFVRATNFYMTNTIIMRLFDFK